MGDMKTFAYTTTLLYLLDKVEVQNTSGISNISQSPRNMIPQLNVCLYSLYVWITNTTHYFYFCNIIISLCGRFIFFLMASMALKISNPQL